MGKKHNPLILPYNFYHMKKRPFFSKSYFLLSIIVLLCTIHAYAEEIHIAKDGVNTLSGRGTVASPYKTIMYVFNNNLVSSGDVILIHQGFYRETVTVNVDNITLKPFENDKVVISGANWYGSDSWQADSSRPGVYKLTLNNSQVETDFTQLFVNGKHQQIARFPNNTTSYTDYISGSHKEMMNPRNQNSGFAVLLNGSKPTGTNETGQVTFSDLSGTPIIPNVTFTNEAIVRGFIGKLRNNIFSSSQDGGQVTRAGDRLVTFKSFNTQGNIWGQNDAVTLPEGFGYVMDLSVLDTEGEWFYKRNENTLYYKPEGGTIAGKNFEIKRRKYVMKILANNVKVQNIDMRCGEVELKNTQNTIFTKCKFTYMTPYIYRRTYGVLRQGIVLDNADNTTFESCYIGHTWGSGIIVLKGSDNSIINNSIIEQIGWMGQFTVALENNGNNTQITQNTFGKASRFHIRTTEHVYAKITDNDFDSAMAMGEDAGAIMFTSTGKPDALNVKGTEIAYNQIHGLKGIPAYDPQNWSTKKFIVALYLEDSENYTVHHNLIYDNNDEYTSVRTSSNGNPEETRNINHFAYLGPRTKKLNLKMEYYNNTAWDYNHLIGFWQQTSDGDVNDMTVKNNLFKTGTPNTVDGISEPNLKLFAQAAASRHGYSIVAENNEYITTSTNHYEDASNGNFRLKSGSPYNTSGVVIPGITSEITPALGAWEGNTNTLKNRVFNAGSNLTSSSFDDNNLSTNDILVEENKLSLSPNPFKDELKVKLENSSSKNNLIRLYGIRGDLIYQTTFTDNQTTINLSKINIGIYFLEVKTDKSKMVKKIIKL